MPPIVMPEGSGCPPYPLPTAPPIIAPWPGIPPSSLPSSAAAKASPPPPPPRYSVAPTSAKTFEVDTGSYPRGQDGLQQLLVASQDVTGWRGPYLMSDIPLDPWGHVGPW